MSRPSVSAQSRGQVKYEKVRGFPGYRVGDDGSVESCRLRGQRERLSKKWRKLKPNKMHDGYVRVRLQKDGVQVRRRVHILVLTEFVGPCPEGWEACHFPDNDKSNNRLSNLRWATKTENERDKLANGTKLVGSQCNGAKLTEDQVREIRRRHVPYKCTLNQLAREFGVVPTTIRDIVIGKTWTHI